MRFSPLLFALSACGTEVMTTDQTDTTKPDAGVRDGRVADAVPVPSDGIPANLTPCEEAVYHSDLAWIQSAVFDVSCTTKCHGDTPPAAGMSLRAGESRVALVNMPSSQFSGWTRVVPGNPSASMLMVQLGGEPGPELEGFMPWGQPRLCPEKIDAIRRWIAAGAQP
jgi:hypothetical protein